MDRRSFVVTAVALLAEQALAQSPQSGGDSKKAFRVTHFPTEGVRGSRDVVPAPDGETVWVMGQRNGVAGRFSPRSQSMTIVRLGEGAAPHGVVIGPDQAAWITEGGQNAIARIDNETHKVELFRLPAGWAHAHLNTGVFDKSGIYWFTGQGGVLGRLDPASGRLEVWEAPRGPGPYGITSTPENEVWYASLAGSFIARLDRETRRSEIVEPPVPDQGARRIWSDSKGRLWISEWNAGNVSAYDPAAKYWQYWRVPGEQPRPYAVYVDNQDIVWLSDHAANAVLRFDPLSETFTSFPSSKPGASVRQLDGRPGEVWGGESGLDRLVRIETVSAS